MADQSTKVQIGNGLQYAQPVVIVDGDGGGGGGDVTVTNWPASQAVTGPITNAQFTAVMGTASTPAWNGTDANATVIAILKSLHPILNLINMEVNEIDTDMEVVKSELIAINANTATP